jgi:DNA-damage-inducible protein J
MEVFFMALTQTTTINVRVDESVKRNVEVLFDTMGMNISTAVNIFFRQCLMEEALPFQPKVKYNVSLIEALKEAQEQAKVNGTSNMTLEEINCIVAEVRREMRGQQ